MARHGHRIGVGETVKDIDDNTYVVLKMDGNMLEVKDQKTGEVQTVHVCNLSRNKKTKPPVVYQKRPKRQREPAPPKIKPAKSERWEFVKGQTVQDQHHFLYTFVSQAGHQCRLVAHKDRTEVTLHMANLKKGRLRFRD